MRSVSRRFLSILFLLAMLLSPALGSAGTTVPEGFTVFHGDRDVPQIALSVDDCYSREHVTEILDLCEEYNIPVTFFVVGKALKTADQDLWQRALDLGCEIGNHTWAHSSLPTLNREKVKKTLTRTQEQLDKVLGYHYPMQLMRPSPTAICPPRRARRAICGWWSPSIRRAMHTPSAGLRGHSPMRKKALKNTQNWRRSALPCRRRVYVRCLTKLIPNLLDEGLRMSDARCALLGLEDPVPEDVSDGRSGRVTSPQRPKARKSVLRSFL